MAYSNNASKRRLRPTQWLVGILGVISIIYLSYIFSNVIQQQEQHLIQFDSTEIQKLRTLDSLNARFVGNHVNLSQLLIDANSGRDEGELYDLGIELIDKLQTNVNNYVNASQLFQSDKLSAPIYAELLNTLHTYQAACRSAIEMTTVDLELAHESVLYANQDYKKVDELLSELRQLTHSKNKTSFVELLQINSRSLQLFFGAAISAIFVLLVSAYLALRTISNKTHALSQRTQQLEKSYKEIDQQKNRVVSILERMNEGFLRLNNNWEIQEINNKACQLLHIDKSQLANQHIWDNLPEFASGFYKKLNQSKNNIAKLEFEAYYAPTDRWFYTQTFPTNKELVIFFRDITEKRLYIKSLERSEKRIRSIVDNALDAIITLSHTGDIESFNMAAEKMFGYKQKHILGTNITRLIPEMDYFNEQRSHTNFSRSDQSEVLGKTSQLQANHKDGRAFPIEMSFTELHLGEQILYTGVVRDITGRIKAEEKTQAAILAKLDAESASTSKSLFLANMSHEIRTPLGIVIGFSELLLDSDQSMEERTNAINTIISNGKHLQTIINDILDLSKIEANKLEVEIQPTDLEEIIQDIRVLFEHKAIEKGLSFVVNYNYPLPRIISTDPIKLKQIIINLCSNALKFTEKGYISVTLSYEQQNDKILLSIQDTGIGLSEEQQLKIFEQFTQADATTTRKYGGTGLGLALSRQLARLLNGDINIVSTPGNGSKFTLSLCIDNVEPGKLVNNYAQNPVPLAQPTTHQLATLKGDVLLTEDTVANQVLIQRHLEKMGTRVTLANNGEEAVAHATKQEFDIILMDMQMPVLGGLEATRQLRSQGYTKPIIALTANAMQEDKDACLSSGCNDFLTKPITRTTLYKALTNYLVATDTAMQQAITPIHSELLAEAPELINLVIAYTKELPAILEHFKNLYASQQWDELRSQAHQMKATGGTHGYSSLSALAAKIEFQLMAQHTNELENLFDEFYYLIKGIDLGLPTNVVPQNRQFKVL